MFSDNSIKVSILDDQVSVHEETATKMVFKVSFSMIKQNKIVTIQKIYIS